MRLRLCLPLASTLVLSALGAQAQQALTTQQGLQTIGSDASLGVVFMPVKAPVSNEYGVRLSEGTTLHLGLGAEAGYDTNVFFVKNDPQGAPQLRIIPFLQLTNAGREGAIPTSVFYDISATLLYREYLTSDPNVKAQRAFNPAANALVEFGPGQAVTFSLMNMFMRLEEPPFGASMDSIVRLTNLASAQIRWAPGGGRFQGLLRYSNNLDIFETDFYKGANLMGHEGVLDLSWRWLPKTAVFAQIAQGLITYLDREKARELDKYDSRPLRAIGGLRGLLTEKTALLLAAGYLNGFYKEGATNPSQLGIVGELSYNPTLLTRLVLGYRHEFRNSVIGDFYNVDGGYLSLRSLVASRVTLGAFGRYEFRRFSGIRNLGGGAVDRDDHVFQGGGTADLFLRQWFYAGVSYVYTLNRSNLDGPAGLDYTKQLILGRLGVTY